MQEKIILFFLKYVDNLPGWGYNSLIKEVKGISEIKRIRTDLGMSRVEFAERFHIPIRTLEHWELDRTPPSYLIPLLLDLIAYQEKARKYAVAYNKLLESVGALPEE